MPLAKVRSSQWTGHELHDGRAEGVVVVTGRGVAGIGQLYELGARNLVQKIPDTFGADHIRQLAADQQDRDLQAHGRCLDLVADRKRTRLNSSHHSLSYAVFCLKQKKTSGRTNTKTDKEVFRSNLIIM